MLRIFSLRESVQLRFYSIKRATKEPTRYTNTINLPRTKFPARLGVAKRTEIEEELNEVNLFHLSFENGQWGFAIPRFAHCQLLRTITCISINRNLDCNKFLRTITVIGCYYCLLPISVGT